MVAQSYTDAGFYYREILGTSLIMELGRVFLSPTNSQTVHIVNNKRRGILRKVICKVVWNSLKTSEMIYKYSIIVDLKKNYSILVNFLVLIYYFCEGFFILKLWVSKVDINSNCGSKFYYCILGYNYTSKIWIFVLLLLRISWTRFMTLRFSN